MSAVTLYSSQAKSKAPSSRLSGPLIPRRAPPSRPIFGSKAGPAHLVRPGGGRWGEGEAFPAVGEQGRCWCGCSC